MKHLVATSCRKVSRSIEPSSLITTKLACRFDLLEADRTKAFRLIRVLIFHDLTNDILLNIFGQKQSLRRFESTLGEKVPQSHIFILHLCSYKFYLKGGKVKQQLRK